MHNSMWSKWKDRTMNVEMICQASALNFLLITEGCAVLRYTT